MTQVPSLAKPYWQWTSGPPDKHLAASMMNDPRFQELMTNLPDAEIESLLKIPSDRVESLEQKKDFAKTNVVFMRLFSRICNKCFRKDNCSQLRACSKCQLTFYCNETCQTADWTSHKTWCCQKNSKADQGPLRTVILHTK